MPPSRPSLSWRRPVMVTEESEPSPQGPIPATTVFLTASPCPIGCRMCDLHRNTLPGPVPPGAIPEQIDAALVGRPRSGWLKLYNSGNFFDPQSIPQTDYEAIARRCTDFSRLVVENHPRFGQDRLLRFRDLLAVPLEVAVGLETVQPRWLDRLGKRMTRDDFDRYAKWLSSQGVDLRVFLIIGAPGISVQESVRWVRLSIRHAVMASARHISLIPARVGEGWGGRGDRLPCLSTETLAEIQRFALRDVDGRAMVTIDLWDIDQRDPGFNELQQRNLDQLVR
mgnify:FL=1